MKKNVLVFPCGSEIGLELNRSLKHATHIKLFGGSSVADHGEFVYDNYLSGIPHVESNNFIDEINKVIDLYNIDFIFPAHDSVVLKLAEAEAAGAIRCKVITSPLSTCRLSRSKKATYKALENTVPVPKVYNDLRAISAEGLPLFLKPDIGQGSKGTQLVKSIAEAEFYTEKDPSLLILEYLPGKEYTVDCFTDRNGVLRHVSGRERARVSGGISVSSFRVSDARFSGLANKLNESLVFRGVWFFQVKENADGELVLLEIAPRVAGTMALERVRGVNLPLLSFFDALDYDVEIMENDYQIEIDRALASSYKHDLNYEHVYLDLDDLIIFDGKINTQVLAFIFQCRNKNISVNLLTRHKGNLDRTLKSFHIDGIFDKVIWIQDGAPKSNYIDQKSSIFIDDSFAERKEVANKLNISVFDSHMVEGLMV